ncbi:uncharacterized protein [Henckelia pumila]|uniref:uncharacterized protein isoform X5 n=1 Tax=Henckelia pumila TaxID=405737 RepID=UPI003C6E838E
MNFSIWQYMELIPLLENEFRDAIRENYLSAKKLKGSQITILATTIIGCIGYKRRRVKLCGNYHFGLPFPLKSPRSAAASRRTRILFHSNGMPKREMNKTYYNNRSEGLNYCLVVFLPLIFKWFQSFQFSCLYYVGAMHGKISCVKKLIEAGDNAVFWLVVPRLIREARRK